MTGSRLAQTSVNRSRQSAEAQMRGRTLSSVVRYLVPKLFSASWTLGDPAIEACLNRCRAKSRKDPAKRPQTPVDYDFVNFGA